MLRRDIDHGITVVYNPSYSDIEWPEDPAIMAVDIETVDDDQNRMHRASGKLKLVTWTFDGRVVYAEDAFARPNGEIEAPVFYNVVTPVALNSNMIWVLHNGTFDLAYFMKSPDFRDIQGKLKVLPRYYRDTRLMEKALYSNWYKSASLAAITARRFDVVLDKDIREEFVKQVHWEDPLTDEQVDYAAMDAAFTWRIYDQQRKEVQQAPDMLKQAILLDAKAAWSTLHFAGAPVDVAEWRANAGRNATALDQELRSFPANPRSPKQVLKWLAGLGIHTQTTSAKELKRLAAKHPEVQRLLEIRKLSKLTSSYGEEWLKFVDDTGMVYPSYNVYGAETSRWSSSNPNLQQIPRGDYRKMFKAPPGYSWVIADYSQQEVRIAAWMAGDKKLIDLLDRGDVYTEVGRIIYRDPTMLKSDKRRQLAKSAVLGLLYGLTPSGMAKNQGISKEQAYQVFDGIKAEFPALWRFIHDHRKAQADGYVSTVMGHMYWLNLWAWNWKNNAANSPVQGSGSDMVKLAVYKYTLSRPFEIALVVHDEIAALVKTDEAPVAKEFLERCMREAFEECLPGMPSNKVAEAHIGQSWADKE
jgi:DNA polymerase-1